MTQNEYQIIKLYLGIELLKFILNKPEIQDLNSILELKLTDLQVSVLKDLKSKIKEIRIHHIEQGCYGDGLVEEGWYGGRLEFGVNKLTPDFNKYRKLCAGTFPDSKWQSDPIMNFLYEVVKENYSALLTKRTKHSNFITYKYNEEFSKLVKKDILNKLTNNKEGLEHSFKFTIDCDNEFYTQVSLAPSTIVSRSFLNCCNEMSFDFESLMIEIENNVKLLRSLANNEKITFKSYIGIKGLALEGIKKIDLGNASIYQLSSISNPSYHTKSIATTYTSNEDKYLSGCILSIKHETKVLSLESNSNYTFTRKNSDYQDKILRAFKLALVFTLKEDKGVVASFNEIGFPLISPGNYSQSKDTPGKYLKLSNSNLEQFQDWYKLLSNTNLENVLVTVKRLEYAIFGRKTPEDAIMDAIIAWEGMFSEAFETTFKVTAAITKYLNEDIDKREKYLKRLKKLYNLRSEIVHGKKSKLLEKENIESLRKEVIKVGLECLSKLLQDEEMLNLSPPERIKKILIMN